VPPIISNLVVIKQIRIHKKNKQKQYIKKLKFIRFRHQTLSDEDATSWLYWSLLHWVPTVVGPSRHSQLQAPANIENSCWNNSHWCCPGHVQLHSKRKWRHLETVTAVKDSLCRSSVNYWTRIVIHWQRCSWLTDNDWLVFNGTSTQKGQFVPTAGTAQSAKNGQRDTMHYTSRYAIVDQSAAELSRRRRRKMVTRQISAENWKARWSPPN